MNFNDVAAQWREIEAEALPDVLDVLRNGPYILGEKVKAFEAKFAEVTWTPYALGVSNGSDALRIAVQVVAESANPAVLVQANAHISDALAGALESKVEFIDCDEYYNIDVEGLRKWRNYEFILILTHMYGQAGNIREILNECPGAIIIEDCSQAFGATSLRKPVGSLGSIGCYSLYPTKNLGAAGDAGMIVTSSPGYYERLKLLREYGQRDKLDCVDLGWNCRLDEIQAAILLHKIGRVKGWIARKREIAAAYHYAMKDLHEVIPPRQAPYADEHTWHIFAIRVKQRDALRKHLADRGIPTLVHYPMTLNNTSLFKESKGKCPRAEGYSKELISLPIHPYMTDEDVAQVCKAVGDFYE